MKGERMGSRYAGLVSLLVVAACAGTRLNDVGDVGGDGGDGGGGKSSVAQAGSLGTGDGGASAGSSTVPRGGSKGNVGGTGIALPPDEVVSGASEGGAPARSLDCARCEVVSAAPDIRGVAAGQDRVFWIEYGSYDGLGNYKDDGRLMSQAFAGGEPVVVAEGLQGPVEVEVSDDFAYVLVEQSSVAAGAIELTRISLGTGDVEVLQAVPGYQRDYNGFVVDWFNRYFVAKGGFAFWAKGNAIYRLAEDAAGPPRKFLDSSGIFSLLGDESLLYLYDAEGIKSVPYIGGQPTLIRALAPVFLPGQDPDTNGFPAYFALSLVGDYIYGFELGESSFLARMPKVGGAWKHLVGFDNNSTQLVIEGEEYFDDRLWRKHPDSEASCSLRSGKLSGTSPAEILAISPTWRDSIGLEGYWRAWDVAPSAVYFGWEDTLYRVPRTP